MFSFIMRLVNRILNPYQDVQQEESSTTVEENSESAQAEERYSEALQKLIEDGHSLEVLHNDALGNKEIIGDDQVLRSEIIIRYNIETSGL